MTFLAKMFSFDMLKSLQKWSLEIIANKLLDLLDFVNKFVTLDTSFPILNGFFQQSLIDLSITFYQINSPFLAILKLTSQNLK